jgi:hypothetical protein
VIGRRRPSSDPLQQGSAVAELTGGDAVLPPVDAVLEDAVAAVQRAQRAGSSNTDCVPRLENLGVSDGDVVVEVAPPAQDAAHPQQQQTAGSTEFGRQQGAAGRWDGGDLAMGGVSVRPSPHRQTVRRWSPRWLVRLSQVRAERIARRAGPTVKPGDVRSLAFILRSLPVSTVPFVLGMFCISEALVRDGTIDGIAGALVSGLANRSGSLVAASTVPMLLTIVCCNLFNNQPASIVLTRIVLSPKFLAAPPDFRIASIVGIISGANFAANFTPVGALAGLLFLGIAKARGCIVSFADFAKTGAIVMIPVLAIAMIATWIQQQI